MMFTYRVALLNALGIDYEGWSEFLVMRGKQYKRGPSFTIQEYQNAAEYCLSKNMQGLACILVDNSIELTAWLHIQNVDSTATNQIDDSQTLAREQQSSQETPQQPSESKIQMIYRGIKYDVSKPNR